MLLYSLKCQQSQLRLGARGFKTLYIPKFCKYKYLLVKTVSLATVKSHSSNLWMSNILPRALAMDYFLALVLETYKLQW